MIGIMKTVLEHCPLLGYIGAEYNPSNHQQKTNGDCKKGKSKLYGV